MRVFSGSRAARTFICCLCLLGCAAPVWADAPELKALSPAGVQSGGSVTASIIGKAGTAPVQAWCDRDDVSLQVSEKGDELTVAASPDAAPGLCWIRLYNSEGASTLRPFFIGVLPEATETEPNNATTEAQPLDAAGVTLNGVLHQGGEVDTFSVELQAGQTLVASLESAYTLGSPMDGVLQLLSADGFVIRQNDDDHGIDPQIDFTAPADGRYFVRVFAFPRDPNSSIQFAGGNEYIYRLTITTGPFVDHIEPLPDSGSGQFMLRGWNLPPDALPISVASVDGQAAAVLPFPGSFQFERMPPPGNDMILPAGASPYRLPQLPASVWGAIDELGDTDEVAFTSQKGTRLDVTASARRFGSLLDPVIQILDGADKVLQTTDDSGGNSDPELTFEVPADGDYRVRITDRFAHGGERYVYALRVEPESVAPSFRLEQDAFTVKAGGSVEIPVSVSGTIGDGEIGIMIEGLPEAYSVTFTPPKAEDGGRRRRNRREAADKGTIRIEAPGDAAHSGPISVIITPADESASPQAAVAPLPGLSLTTRRLWLTTTPAE